MDETKTIIIRIDASKAVDGSAAATRALQNLEKQAGSMDSTMARIEKSIVSMGTAAKVWLADKLIEVASRIFEFGKSALEAAANLGEMAEQMGITATGLQSLQFAAVQNSLKVEELQTSVAKFSQKLGEAAGGSKTMIDALNNIGVKMLDAQGKIRPTETLLQEVATAITGIEDPAKRASAAVDFFGKAGTKMLPTLKEIADGMDVMASKAAKAGAMISQEAIDKLDKMADAGERSRLVMRALFAENAAGPLTDVLDFINRKVQNLSNILKAAKGDLVALLFIAMNPGAAIGSALASTPQEKNAGAITKLEGDIAGYQRSLDAGDLGPRGQQSQRDQIAKAQAELATRRAAALGFQAKTDKANSGLNIGDPDGIGVLVTRNSGGASNPTSKEDASAAQSIADRIKKETDSLKAAADAQDLMTAAARRGDVAFTDQEAHVTALQKAIDIYGGKLDATDPKVQKLTASLEDQIKRAKEGKAAETFAVATTELEKQNVLLDAQNRLMNEAPEVQAREIALIKAKQDIEKLSVKDQQDLYEKRRVAIEQNETLKIQAEQLKAAQELWTAPLKQALQNIQTAGADAFETMLNTGNFTFQSLGDTFGKIVKRMAAEFLALATIRPVMSILVTTLSAGGLVSPAMASQLGFPSGGAGGGSPLSLLSGGGMGGGGLGNLFGGGTGGATASGGGWLARQFSGIGDFMGRDVSTLFGGATATPAGGFANVGDLLSSGQLGASASITGGLSIGSALGGLGSIGMGAYGLMSGKGGVASTIGSAAQIAGGVMMMIPGLQPFGAALSLLGGLGGMFGGDGPKTPPQPALVYSAGGFATNGTGGYVGYGDSMNGGASMAGQAGSIGQSLLSLFGSAGLKVNPMSLIGGELASGTDHTLNGNQWSDRAYTQTSLRNPDGSIQRLTYNDSSQNPQQAAEYLLAQVFKANVLLGGVSGASDSLKTALGTANPTTQQGLTDLVDFTTAFDKLGKAANPVKDALDKLNATFADMTSKATTYGLSLEPIAAEQARQTKRAAQDFIDQFSDPLAVQMRALDDERQSALASAQYIKDNITGVYVDMDKIATYYTTKEATLRDQFYQGSVESLQNLIARMTYGDLANASPDTSLMGTRASYNANLAQARAGDTSAITNLSSYAEAYATSARSYFASGPEYQALIAQIRQSLSEVVGSVTGGASATGQGNGVSTAQSNTLVEMLTETQNMFRDSMNENADLKNQMAILTAQVRMLTTNRM